MMAGPQWVRLDVGYFSNPKVLRAGRDAAMLHLAAVCYLGAHELDDGILPAEAVQPLVSLVRVSRSGETLDRLVKCGLWHRADDGGFIVHDYDVMNGARSEAAAARQRQRDRRAKQRAKEQEA
jgi:hypothetical protein